MHPTDIKKTIRGYYKQSFTNKFENLDAIDQLLKKQQLLNMTQEEIENLNNFLT